MDRKTAIDKVVTAFWHAECDSGMGSSATANIEAADALTALGVPRREIAEAMGWIL